MSPEVVLLPRPRMPPRWVFLVVGLVLVAMLAVGLWWTSGAEQRAITRLPERQRSELFQKTYSVARTVCAPGAQLDSECRHQAELLLEFPECDRACQRFARARLNVPGR